MEAEAAALIVLGLKYLGAGLAMTGAIGAGAGVGIVVGGAVQGIARNPDAAGEIQSNMILGV
ncbi:MAG TPA: F0F1 ATP synthase subunit C, partial [Anaerolineae bacterium]|nr:F0F1 ATP synthase subunit C [Anaerolineae bacterium]